MGETKSRDKIGKEGKGKVGKGWAPSKKRAFLKKFKFLIVFTKLVIIKKGVQGEIKSLEKAQLKDLQILKG